MPSSDLSPSPRSINRPIVNSLLTIDERNDIYQSIATTKAELQRIETDIAVATVNFLKRREMATDNLSQLKRTLVIQRVLSVEIIGYIFSILRAETVSIPHKRHKPPPQIIVSHVCSKWRKIALATPALWSSVEITQPNSNRWVQVATELLFNRAGKRGANLALDMEEIVPEEMGNAFYNIVLSLPAHVKKLHLTLTPYKLESLLQFFRSSDDIIANIDEISLNINAGYHRFSNTPHWFPSKIRSLICCSSSFIQDQNLPWAQMRYLNTCNTYLPISIISDILRRSPLLKACKIWVELDDKVEVVLDDAVEPLTLSQLRIFHMIVLDSPPRRSLDIFLQSFECPNLMDLRIETQHWNLGTYNIIQNHYNLHRLLKLNLGAGGCPYPISKVLHDAPVLQELIISRKFLFMDESTMDAIPSGKFGRCLTSLGLTGNFDVKGVLDMIAARQRCAKRIIEAGHGWRDQISVIRRVFVLDDNRKSYKPKFKEEVKELKKMGIDVVHPDDSDSEYESNSKEDGSESE